MKSNLTKSPEITTGTEKFWITPSGLLALIVMTEYGHRCGYVSVPKGHPLYGVDYSEETFALKPVPADTPLGRRSPLLAMKIALEGRIPCSPERVFDVHGGLTYAGQLDKTFANAKVTLRGDALWWFGYDCAHCMDAPSSAYQAHQRERYPDKPYMWGNVGVHRTREFCTDQCNSLAEQIVTLTRNRFTTWLARVWAALHHQHSN